MVLFKSVVFAFLATGVLTFKNNRYKSLKYSNGNYDSTYSFDQIYGLLDKTLTCLEQTPDLSYNSTVVMVQCLAFLHMVFPTVPEFNDNRIQLVKSIEHRLETFIYRSLELYPEVPSNSLWYSYYYGSQAKFDFEPGRVPNKQPLDKTLTQIISDHERGEYANQCFKDIILDNPKSYDPRSCKLRCQDQMHDMDYNTGITPYHKAWYINYALILNCTNTDTEVIKEQVVHLCKYIKQEVDTMLLYKHTPQFDDVQAHFNERVLYCSGWGIPEFLSKDIISTVIQRIDCNGCTGVERSSDEKQVLTAQTVGILGNVIRLIIEQNYEGIEDFIF